MALPQPRAPTGTLEIGEYRITCSIGKGACGVVYGGFAADGTPVALKTLWPGFSTTRFERECRILTNLAHPHIVRVFGTVAQSTRAFLVMERVDGTSLGDLIHTRTEFHSAMVASIGVQLCDALGYAHAEGVVHRDVTPGNVLITEDDRAMLLDFGIARSRGDTLITRHGEILGTPGFMAPEVVEGADATGAADQYGLGRTLFEMSCRAECPMPRPRGVLGVLTAGHNVEWDRVRPGPNWDGLFPVLRRMLSKKPEDRYRTMQEAGDELRRLIPPSMFEPDERPTEDNLIEEDQLTLLSAKALMFDGSAEVDFPDETSIDPLGVRNRSAEQDEQDDADQPTQLEFSPVKRNVA